jgi:hypothetical protein
MRVIDNGPCIGPGPRAYSIDEVIKACESLIETPWTIQAIMQSARQVRHLCEIRVRVVGAICEFVRPSFADLCRKTGRNYGSWASHHLRRFQALDQFTREAWLIRVKAAMDRKRRLAMGCPSVREIAT